jgi:predicted nucleic acid-binding protein
MDGKEDRRKFVDTNIFLYAIQANPEFGKRSKEILKRVDEGEKAVTSLINLAEICWWLEKHGSRDKIEEELRLINSILNLEIIPVTTDDLLLAAKFVKEYSIDFNDCISLAVMKRMKISTICSNDRDFDRTWVKRSF